MLGIAVGVAVLITVLSVMNGFDQEIRHRLFSMARQVTVGKYGQNLSNWAVLSKQLETQATVVSTAPYVDGMGMLSRGRAVRPAQIIGIYPQAEGKVSVLPSKVTMGSLKSLKPGAFTIVLGEQLAASLGVLPGEKVMLMIPQASVTPMGVMPRFKRFTVGGIFSVGKGFGFDNAMAFIHLADAQTLYRTGNKVSGIRIKMTDLYHAPELTQALKKQLGSDYRVENWTEFYGAFFKAIKLEKTMMFLILTLIIAVAVFNLVSALVMIVNDKQADIAILRTLGATPRTILGIFMVQGVTVGIVGTLLGLLGGLLLAHNVTHIVNGLQSLLHMRFISSSVYFVDYLPSRIELNDVLKVCGLAVVFSLFATLYPAWRASRVQPARALRYE